MQKDDGWTLDGVLSSIRWYAEENDLRPLQIKDIFEAGIAKFRIGEVRHVHNRTKDPHNHE
jgi:hypothetical protein